MSKPIRLARRLPPATVLAVLLALGLVGGPVSSAQEPAQDEEAHHQAQTHEHYRLHGAEGYLGVHLTGLTPELRQHFGAPEGSGVLISRVEPASPAEEAGLRVGDVLTSVDGERIGSAGKLRRAFRGKNEGTLVTLEVYRDGRLEQLSATLGSAPAHASHYEFDFQGLGDIGQTVRIALEEAGIDNLGETLHEALAEVDHAEIRRRIREAMGDVDWNEIHVKIQDAMEDTDWEALRVQLDGLDSSEEIHDAIRKALEAVGNLDFNFDFDVDVQVKTDEEGAEP